MCMYVCVCVRARARFMYVCAWMYKCVWMYVCMYVYVGVRVFEGVGGKHTTMEKVSGGIVGEAKALLNTSAGAGGASPG